MIAPTMDWATFLTTVEAALISKYGTVVGGCHAERIYASFYICNEIETAIDEISFAIDLDLEDCKLDAERMDALYDDEYTDEVDI